MWDELVLWSVGGVILLVAIIAIIAALQGNKTKLEKPRRFCPLCSSELAENETLKGLIVDTKPPQKILIRGCSRCAPATEGGSW